MYVADTLKVLRHEIARLYMTIDNLTIGVNDFDVYFTLITRVDLYKQCTLYVCMYTYSVFQS